MESQPNCLCDPCMNLGSVVMRIKCLSAPSAKCWECWKSDPNVFVILVRKCWECWKSGPNLFVILVVNVGDVGSPVQIYLRS